MEIEMEMDPLVSVVKLCKQLEMEAKEEQDQTRNRNRNHNKEKLLSEKLLESQFCSSADRMPSEPTDIVGGSVEKNVVLRQHIYKSEIAQGSAVVGSGKIEGEIGGKGWFSRPKDSLRYGGVKLLLSSRKTSDGIDEFRFVVDEEGEEPPSLKLKEKEREKEKAENVVLDGDSDEQLKVKEREKVENAVLDGDSEENRATLNLNAAVVEIGGLLSNGDDHELGEDIGAENSGKIEREIAGVDEAAKDSDGNGSRKDKEELRCVGSVVDGECRGRRGRSSRVGRKKRVVPQSLKGNGKEKEVEEEKKSGLSLKEKEVVEGKKSALSLKGKENEVEEEKMRGLSLKGKEKGVEEEKKSGFSVKGKEKEVEEERRSGLPLKGKVKGKEKEVKESGLDLLETLMSGFKDMDIGEKEDADFLETAKRRGVTFPTPRWWPSEEF